MSDKLREAIAADDTARGTMREQFEAWWTREGVTMCIGSSQSIARAAWQASRAAAPQSVEPKKKCGVCGGSGVVEQYTSATAPRAKAPCPFCCGGVSGSWCPTPEGCGPHGCHGACLPQGVEPVAVPNSRAIVDLLREWQQDPEKAQAIEEARRYLAPPSAPTDAAWRAENERLRVALRFYARGEHYNLDESEEFDTVSGEPDNWLCSGLDQSSTMIETGRVALCALQGIEANWIDGGEDCTPQPIEGEKALRAHIATRPLPAPPTKTKEKP